MAYKYGEVANCKVRNGQTRTEYECRLGYEVQSQSIENNTSTVKLRLECRSISSSYTTKGSSGLTSVIDGATVKNNASVDMSSTNTWQNFGERTITITHNADGTYSASKSGSFTCTAGSSNYSLSSGSASVTVAPTTIPRASQPSLVTYPTTTQNVTIGNTIYIHMNRVSDSFTHTIRYVWGNKSGTIATGVTVNYSWTIPMNFCDNIPNSTSGTGTVYVDTYSGSTLVGTKSVSFTGIVPDSVVPSISSINLSEASSVVPSSWGIYVQSKSQLKVVTSASGSYSSSITSYRITGIDNNTYWSSDFTSSILQIVGTRTITVTITDSRGRTATETTTYTCVAYSNPSISIATVTRCNSDGTTNAKGTYVKYSFKASVAPVNNKNTYSFRLGYKKKKDSYYTYIDIANDSYTIDKADIVLTDLTFTTNNSYDFQFLVNDYFTSSSNFDDINAGFKLFNFNKSGKSMAIGKMSEAEEDEEILEIGLDMYDKNGNMVLGNSYSTEEQVIGTWIDGKLLYRKTIVFPNGIGNTGMTTYYLTDYGINNVEEIFIATPSYYTMSDSSGLLRIYPFPYNDGNAFAVFVTSTVFAIQLQFETISKSKCVITLEYTKTID